MIEYLMIALGLFLLYQGAEWLVGGASSLARRFGVSSLVVGLTVVAFGTSMPELIVNVFAALSGNSEISFGNIIGSNILNILLILGLAASITPLAVKRSTVWREIPFAFLSAVVLFVMSNKVLFLGSTDNTVNRTDGMILIFFLVVFLYYLFSMMRKTRNGEVTEADKKDEIKKHSGMKLTLLIVGGMLALAFGGRLTVNGAVIIARNLGVSEFLISSTIVAIGTSLPELVTSIIAALKKEMDISVGNILGSNIFNVFLVMGVSSIIAPLKVPMGVNFNFIVLLAASLLLFGFMFSGTKHKIDRWEGILFLACYVAYTFFLIRLS